VPQGVDRGERADQELGGGVGSGGKPVDGIGEILGDRDSAPNTLDRGVRALTGVLQHVSERW